jgi:hypothetical protein
MNCGPLSEMFRGFASGYFSLARSDHFNIGFLHRLPQIPMHEETTVPIQDTAQVIEGSADVDIGNIDMPVLVWLQRLLKAGPLARWFGFPP